MISCTSLVCKYVLDDFAVFCNVLPHGRDTVCDAQADIRPTFMLLLTDSHLTVWMTVRLCTLKTTAFIDLHLIKSVKLPSY